MNVINHWPFDGLIGDPNYFDPNDSKYKCCCQQCHAATGVKIIAGLICVTVLMEIWHLGWYLVSGAGTSDGILSSFFQLLMGLFLSITIIYALWSEKAAFLLPYLLLQTIGLAGGFVILFALVYVTVVDDTTVIKGFVESYSPKSFFDGTGNQKTGLGDSPKYLGWMMVGSCVVVIALQFWLISVVFSCWRFFRDKKAYGYTKGYNSYIVLRPPFLLDKHSPRSNETVIFHKLLRSFSADDLSNYSKPPSYRSHSNYVSTTSVKPKLSTISYDCSTRRTVFIR
ncbi:hypothetical protein FO519_008212 [Halicephalobus sp. NKZ332]|nr:hypothetical protein FO519_008212 [Halicephalobus sp. NKZ332]